jgi:hypothetical protein
VNAPPLIPNLPGQAAHAPLRTRRCVRHAEREAAARCSRCGGFFCRECVVDHKGRLVCADCLARAAAPGERKPRRSWAGFRRGLALLAAVCVLWILFYAIGSWLLGMPGEFHDGTVWRDPFMD